MAGTPTQYEAGSMGAANFLVPDKSPPDRRMGQRHLHEESDLGAEVALDPGG
jgi:hypothetical protein